MAVTSKPPPDAAAAPVGATDQSALDKRLTPESTAHDPSKCATCELGVQPWTPERRQQAETYAATSGRRIADLPADAKDGRRRGPLEDVWTRFSPHWQEVV